MQAKIALLEQLLADNIEFIFGNPGTTEEGFLDALLKYKEIKYIMGLQESVVVAMADGYARATKRPSIIQLHAAVGLGNAMAMLYQAHRSFTPMVVFAGEAYTKYADLDGFLGGNLVQMASPVTKWATRVTEPSQLLRIWRRAYKVASTPPFGPVFLSLPMDILDAEIDADIHPTSLLNVSNTPSDETLGFISKELLKAVDPLIIIGDGISMSNAQSEVEELSDIIGAPIYGLDFSDLNVSFKNPLFQGLIGRSFGKNTREITYKSDLLLFIGTPVFPELFPTSLPYFNNEAKIIQIDQNTWEISKNYSALLGVQADPKPTLNGVIKILKKEISFSNDSKISIRKINWINNKQSLFDKRDSSYQSLPKSNKISPARAMKVIVETIPKETIIFDEALTSSDELLHYLQPSEYNKYYLGRGGCIGIGWPSAIGVALANPKSPVLAFSGDGSALYIIQSLWTAAHYKLNLVFVVCNNKSYRILKVNILNYWSEQNINADKFPFMDINNPEIDFKKVAEGFGLTAWNAYDEESLQESIKNAFSSPGPHLIDMVIDGSVSEETKSLLRANCGFA